MLELGYMKILGDRFGRSSLMPKVENREKHLYIKDPNGQSPVPFAFHGDNENRQ